MTSIANAPHPNLNNVDLARAGALIDNRTPTYYVEGGIGVQAKPHLDRLLTEHQIPLTDSNRSWLVTHAADHSQILAFLNPSRDPTFSLDGSIDRATHAAMKLNPSTSPSPGYVAAIDTLKEVLRSRQTEIGRFAHWDAFHSQQPVLAASLLEIAAMRCGIGVDDITTFQAQAAFGLAQRSGDEGIGQEGTGRTTIDIK